MFTGDEDHNISLEEAAQMTSRFRATIPPGAKTGGFFGRTAIRQILAQEGCVGIRYYYGLNDNNDPVLILSGVDTNGNDIFEGELAEISSPCPPNCSEPNPLNS